METKKEKSNRLNAKKSTGPQSEAGKAIASRNAFKHGILSRETVLPWEDRECFQDMRKRLIDALKPTGDIEMMLADRIVSLVWRLRRVGRIETGIYAQKRYSLNYEMVKGDDPFNSVEREKAKPEVGTIPYADAFKEREEATKRKIEISLLIHNDMPELGVAFAESALPISNLHRYETGIERSLYKTLHELERLQASRQGVHVPLPIAVDIET